MNRLLGSVGPRLAVEVAVGLADPVKLGFGTDTTTQPLSTSAQAAGMNERIGAGRRATSQSLRSSSAFSTTSAIAGWIQYWPRAIALAGVPKLIAWISGWMSDDACGPMMCAPSSSLVVRVGEHLDEVLGVLHRPAVRGVAVVLAADPGLDPLLAACSLGQADRGDLRVGEHRVRHEPVVGC